MNWIKGNTDWFKSIECVNAQKGIYYVNYSPSPYTEDGNEDINVRYINDRVTHILSTQEIKDRVLAIQEEYDSSSEVNGFTINGELVWLDKATRVGLNNSLAIQKEQGLTTTTLWLNGEAFFVDIDVMVAALKAIELYAIECYNNTQRHIQTINTLTSREELLNYDVTVGYPAQLTFNV